MTFKVPLGRRIFALIDDDDAERVARHDWLARRSDRSIYAYSDSKLIGKNMRLLHRYLMRAPVDVLVDHRNGNGLDCRKENLREATPSQNGQNQFVQRCHDKASMFKGVSRCAASGKWNAKICLNGEASHLGLFGDEIEAACAYDDAAAEMFGDFARTNEMMGLFPGQSRSRRGFDRLRGIPILKTPRFLDRGAMEARANRKSRARDGEIARNKRRLEELGVFAA